MLDCDVVIDKLILRQPFCEWSSKVFMLGVFGDAELFISTNMLTDIHYILEKELGSQQAQAVLLENVGTLQICGVSAIDAVWAMSQNWTDFEDCLVARAADNVKADYIVTRDNHAFLRSKVPAISPESLMKLLEQSDSVTYREVT